MSNPHLSRRQRFYLFSFLRHDLPASITVFFVALPLCLGIALASGAPAHAGIIAGIVGGLVVSLVSQSSLSVSGPAAGLTTICAAAIGALQGLEAFYLSVAIAGILQLLLGWFKLGGFTHFIPAAVIKGMLSAIGVILIAKQIPLLIGYDQPDFWRDELVNLLTFSHGFEGIKLFYESLTPGALVVALFSAVVMFGWQKWFAKKLPLLPGSFVVVLAGSLCAFAFHAWVPSLALRPEQMVALPANMLASIDMPSIDMLFANAAIWKYGVILCFVASLETLLSVVAVDKLDPYNRITP